MSQNNGPVRDSVYDFFFVLCCMQIFRSSTGQLLSR